MITEKQKKKWRKFLTAKGWKLSSWQPEGSEMWKYNPPFDPKKGGFSSISLTLHDAVLQQEMVDRRAKEQSTK